MLVRDNYVEALYLTKLQSLIDEGELSEQERILLQQALTALEQDGHQVRILYELKQALIPLALKQHLSHDVQALYLGLVKDYSIQGTWAGLNIYPFFTRFFNKK